jgi:basic amino acid/polyamine antiporter, APA family
MAIPLEVSKSASSHTHESLPRVVGTLGSTAIVIGTIIGSGIFLVPHNVALKVGSATSLFLVWIVGGLLALAGSLSLAELGTAMPDAGGIYVYLREAYGRLFAFLYGWGSLLVIDSGSAATLAVAFSIYTGRFIPLSPLGQKLVAVGVIAVLTAINVLGARESAVVQTIFTVAKLTGLAIIVLFAIFTRHLHTITVGSGPLPTAHTTLSSFGVALIGVLWAYQGWHQLSYTAGEIRNPSRALPISYLLGTLIVAGAYLSANWAYLHVISFRALVENERVAAVAMQAMSGSAGALFVSGLILCSIFGALNGTVLTSPRVYFAMGQDRVFFPGLGSVHPRFKTPAVAVVTLGVWGAVLAASGTYEQLYTYVIFAGWIFYGAAIMSVIVLRRRQPDRIRPYRVFGYPILPVAFAFASLAVIGNTLATKPRESLIGIGLILLGLPVYFVWRWLDRTN